MPYVTDIENFGAPATLITKEPAAGCERELRLSRSGGRFFYGKGNHSIIFSCYFPVSYLPLSLQLCKIKQSVKTAFLLYNPL